MKTTPSWQDVYGRDLPSSFPPVPRVDTPYVANPSCPANCSGRHEVDGHVFCPHCGTPAYDVWQHEWPGRPGIYWSRVEPRNGMPEYRKEFADIACVACGRQLKRG